QRIELDPLALDSRLDGVTLKPGIGEVVLDAPAFLPLVLIVGAAANSQKVAANDHAGLRVVGRGPGIGKESPVAELDRGRRPFDVFIGDFEIIDPVVGGMFPSPGKPQFLDILGTDRAARVDPVAQELTAFLAILARNLEQIAAARREVDLSEEEILVEGRVGRTEIPLIFRWEEGDRQAEPWRDLAGNFLPLAFVGHEEMHHVLDDGTAERTAELKILRLDLARIAPEFFKRRRSAHALVGIVDERLAVEFIGTRPRHGGNCYRAHLVELGLVVRGDDTVLADGELRKRVALRRILAGDAVLEDIILLPDPIDEDIDGPAVLCAALQARIPVAARDELHPRRKVGEGEEVAVVLRERL